MTDRRCRYIRVMVRGAGLPGDRCRPKTPVVSVSTAKAKEYRRELGEAEVQSVLTDLCRSRVDADRNDVQPDLQ